MQRKQHIIFIISAVILIPVLLGLTPVKFVQKLGSGCPFAKTKVSLSCNPCIYHSVTSQNHEEYDGNVADVLHTIAFVFHAMLLSFEESVVLAETIDSGQSIKSSPLRC